MSKIVLVMLVLVGSRAFAVEQIDPKLFAGRYSAISCVRDKIEYPKSVLRYQILELYLKDSSLYTNSIDELPYSEKLESNYINPIEFINLGRVKQDIDGGYYVSEAHTTEDSVEGSIEYWQGVMPAGKTRFKLNFEDVKRTKARLTEVSGYVHKSKTECLYNFTK
jgi:hypothetical protein